MSTPTKGRNRTRIVHPALARPEWSCLAKLSYRIIKTSQTKISPATNTSIPQNTLRKVHSYARNDRAPPFLVLLHDDDAGAELTLDLVRGVRAEEAREAAV